MPAKTEVDMLFKSKAPEKDKNAAANAAEVMGGMVQQQHSVVEQVAATPLVPKAETASCIGSGMEVEMLNSMKSGAPEKDKNAAANAAEVMGGTVQPHDQVWARSEPTTKAGTASCIGSDMSIVGKIDCNGPAQVFGRIEGEVRASDLQINDGAQVEGNIIAQNVTVCGRVKGTIRAVRVKLQNGGAVEGDIFHRSLSIDENSQFEGSSRRVENPTEIPSSIDAKIPKTTDTQSATPMSNVDADLQRVESAPTDWSESTVGPKH
jgi:cytoskeletal protein CcmA (bactofilin family)